MTDYNKLTEKEQHLIDEYAKPKFGLVNEKGEIKETFRNKPTAIGMRHYFEKVHLERLTLKKLNKEGKVKEDEQEPIHSSTWLK